MRRKLSTVLPAEARMESREPSIGAFKNCDGRLDVDEIAAEGISWLEPYMMRAKLRLDIAFSRRKHHGYLPILR